jgi:hypothetical protein
MEDRKTDQEEAHASKTLQHKCVFEQAAGPMTTAPRLAARSEEGCHCLANEVTNIVQVRGQYKRAEAAKLQSNQARHMCM